METNKNNSLLKSLGILLVAILGLWLVYTLLFGSGYGINVRFGGYHGGGHFYMGYGYGFTGTLTFFLQFLMKVLFVLFIVGLVVGIIVTIKKYIFTQEDITTIKSTFTGKQTVVNKETCAICGKELKQDWKVCPYCGEELKINE